jgi:hypothetical protein
LLPVAGPRHCEAEITTYQLPVPAAHVEIETYRWFACMLLLLCLGGSLRLVFQALASLAGVSLVWAAHTAVVINRMETAGGC